MIVSIETPVFKGKWLKQCIDSVLTQSSPNWFLSLCWDGGDDQSRRILEELKERNHPNIKIYFEENRGIARARHFLSERSRGDYILPLDDDDVLTADAVEKLLAFVEKKPWSGIVRARRKFIDEDGRVVDQEPWFPFEPRHYQHGMVTDIFNHAQPYLINRELYGRTAGWEGFEDFKFAGEDCDIILKLEELAPIELLDDVLYYYRLNPNRASDELEVAGAHEMWRRLADKSIARMGLPLERENDVPPYTYKRLPQPIPDTTMIDFVIPHQGGMRGFIERRQYRAALKRFGIANDAIHFVRLRKNDIATTLNQGFQQTSRPLVCFLYGGVQVDDPKFFDAMLATLHEQQADIIGPKFVGPDGSVRAAAPCFDDNQLPALRKGGEDDEDEAARVADAQWLPAQLLLVRREVVNAVAGFDAGFSCPRIASADFCLKARQRDFRCLYDGTVAALCDIPVDAESTAADIERYHDKWSSYTHLFWD